MGNSAATMRSFLVALAALACIGHAASLTPLASSPSYDVAVIGGGPLGLAAACSAKQKCPNCTIAVYESGTFGNQHGSTTGLSRQTRIAYTTDALTELAVEASKRWDALERQEGVTLVNKTGMLWFGNPNTHGSEGQIAAAVQVLQRLKLPYEQLNSSQLAARFPLHKLPDDYIGLFTKGAGGTIHVPRTMHLYEKMARRLGIQLWPSSPVLSFTPRAHGVDIIVNQTTLVVARKLIVCPGAYVNQLLKPLGIAVNISIWEWSGAYFKVKGYQPGRAAPELWEQQPIWIRFENASPSDGGMFFGFPDWHDLGRPGMVRINPGYTKHIFSSPSQRTGKPDLEELKQTQQFVGKYLKGIDPNSMEVAEQTCLATIIGGDGNAMVLSFLPDSIPFHKNVVINTAGWGFKLAPLLGDIMAQMAIDGTSSHNISAFAIDQPGVLIHL